MIGKSLIDRPIYQIVWNEMVELKHSCKCNEKWTKLTLFAMKMRCDVKPWYTWQLVGQMHWLKIETQNKCTKMKLNFIENTFIHCLCRWNALKSAKKQRKTDKTLVSKQNLTPATHWLRYVQYVKWNLIEIWICWSKMTKPLYYFT